MRYLAKIIAQVHTGSLDPGGMLASHGTPRMVHYSDQIGVQSKCESRFPTSDKII